MRVKNTHAAPLGVPGSGGDIAPGESGDADGQHHVVKLWLDAGMLVLDGEQPADVEATGDDTKPEGRRRRGG